MKKFILKLFLFIALFFALDKLFILIINYLPELEVDKRLELLVNGKINKELIIIGSSRGARNIIAERIERETGLSSYNLSFPASDITFQEFILRTLVKYNKPPKLLLLTVDDDSELIKVRTIYFRLDRLFSLIKYDHIRQELINRGEKNKMLSKLFMLHRLNISNFDLRKKKFTANDSISAYGSMTIASHKSSLDWNFRNDVIQYTAESENQDMVNSINRIFQICRDQNIELVIVFCPNYKRNSVSFENRMKELAGRDVHFFHYDTLNPIYKNPEYFSDRSHLRINGAETLTGEFSVYLNKEFSLTCANVK